MRDLKSAGWALRFRARLAGLSDGQILVGLFAGALAMRLIYFTAIRDSVFFQSLVGDGATYDAWAQEIRGDFIGKEIFYQAPLYPYFLALIYAVAGHDPVAARVVQMLLGAAACVLLAVAGRRLAGRRVGVVAGALLALYGPALFFEGVIQKTSLDVFFMSALLACLAATVDSQRLRWPLLAGVTLGCLILTRETALVLLPALALWLLLRRHFKAAAFLTLGALLTLSPVAIRNRVVGGELILTTSQFGPNFFIGNNADADGRYTPLRWGHGGLAQERADAVAIAEESAGRHLSPGEVSHHWSVRAWDWIRGHPGDWLRLLGRKLLLLWGDHEISDSDELAVYQDASLLLRVLTRAFSFGVVVSLAAAGMIAIWPARRRTGFVPLMVAALAAATALFVIFGRYRMAMVPPLVLMASIGGWQMWELGRVHSPRLVGYAAAVVVAAVITWVPAGPAADARAEEGAPRAMAFYNLAVTREAQGDLTSAVANYRAAVAADPAFAQAYINLGGLLARGGAFDEAIAVERTALGLRPDDAFAHVNLANALLETGRLDEAESHYQAALRVDPTSESARAGLGALGDVRARAARR